jgi:hypothetical protein
MANAHTTEQRAFIVWSLANCVEPETIVFQFAKRWKGVPCTTSDVAACAPQRLTGEWKKYFDQERAIWQDAPLSDKKNRVALLNRLVIKLESVGGADNIPHLIKAMELLAKEDAGFFVPKPVKGADDGKSDGPGGFSFALDKANADPS